MIVYLLHADLLEFDIVLHAGGLDILGGLLDGIERGVGTIDAMGELAFLRIIIIDIIL